MLSEYTDEEILDAGVVGLRNSGKTVFWTILYGLRNKFAGVNFSFPDEDTTSYLGPRWKALDAGRLPEANQSAKPDYIFFKVKATANGVTKTYSVRTSDYPGAFVSRGRDQDIKNIAKASGLERFVDRSDLILVLIDISDEREVAAQLDTLEYIVQRSQEVPTKHGSDKRPVAIGFTKADMVLNDLNAELVDAQQELLRWMNGHSRWSQIAKFLTEEFRDRRYVECFPVSCFGMRCDPDEAPPPGKIDPRWMHEPVIWALPLAKSLATSGYKRQQQLDQVRKMKAGARRAAYIGIPLLLVLALLYGIHAIGYAAYAAGYQEMEAWGKQHAEPKHAAERLARRANFAQERFHWFNRNFVLSSNSVASEKRKCEADRAVAIEWETADATAYKRVAGVCPISTWADVETARKEAADYLAADPVKIAGRMAPHVRSLKKRLDGFDAPTPGLIVTIGRVRATDKGPSSGTVSVWVAHSPGQEEKSVVHDIVLDNEYPSYLRAKLKLFVKAGDAAPFHVTVKRNNEDVATTSCTLGNHVFKPNQNMIVMVEDRYKVDITIDCKPLQGLTIPAYYYSILAVTPD